MNSMRLKDLADDPVVTGPQFYAFDSDAALPWPVRAVLDLDDDPVAARLLAELRQAVRRHHGDQATVALCALPSNAALGAEPPRPVTVYGVVVALPEGAPRSYQADTNPVVALALGLAQTNLDAGGLRLRPAPPAPKRAIERLATETVETPSVFRLAGPWPESRPPTLRATLDLGDDPPNREIVRELQASRARLYEGVTPDQVTVLLHAGFVPAKLAYTFSVELVVWDAEDNADPLLLTGAEHPGVALLRAYRQVVLREARYTHIEAMTGSSRNTAS